MIPRPPISTLFPYTTLFRSRGAPASRALNQLPASNGRAEDSAYAPHRNLKRRRTTVQHVHHGASGGTTLTTVKVPRRASSGDRDQLHLHGSAVGFRDATREGGADRGGTTGAPHADRIDGGVDRRLVQAAAGVRAVSGVAVGAVSVVGVHLAGIVPARTAMGRAVHPQLGGALHRGRIVRLLRGVSLWAHV